MTRLQKAATIIALALCFVGAIAGELWDASHAPQSPSQRAAANDNRKTDTKTIEERHQTAEDAIATYTLWLMAFTGILAFATAGLGTLNFFQLRLARSEFLSANRPKIRVKHVWLARDIWQGTPIVINLTCVNTGTGEARLNQIGIRYEIVRSGALLPVNPAINAAIYAGGAAWDKGARNVNFENVDIGRIVTAPENTEIQNKRSQLFCIGYVSYWDAADRMRITGFCRVLEFPHNTTARADNARFSIYKDPDYEYED